MKIPTSTSFVMAATASLALQSSALAVPAPDSPDVGRVSPHSARTDAAEHFAGRAPTARTGSGSPGSSPSRGMKLRDLDEVDAASSKSLSDLLQGLPAPLPGVLEPLQPVAAQVDGITEPFLKGIGLGILKARDDKETLGFDAAAPAPDKRQLPVSPFGIPASAGTVISDLNPLAGITPPNVPSLIPSAAGGLPNPLAPLGGGIPQPPLGTGNAQLPGGIPQTGAPVPAPLPGNVEHDSNAVAAPAPPVAPGQIPNTIGQTVGGVTSSLPIGTVIGNTGQIVGGTPAAGVVGSVAGVGQNIPNPPGAAAGVVGGVPIVGGTAGGVIQSVPNPFEAFQGQAEPDDGQVDGDIEYGTASPSSTVAVPSSSPSVVSSSDQYSPSATDSASAVSTASPSETPEPLQAAQAAAAPEHVAPALPLPVSPPVSIPIGVPFAIPSAPIPTSGLPIPVPVPAPVSLPGVPAPPSAPAPPTFVPKKRALGVRAGPPFPTTMTSGLPLPSGFPAPSAPIPNDIPPLLIPMSLAARDYTGGDDTYSSSSASFNNQFSVGSATQVESSTSVMTTLATSTSSAHFPTATATFSRLRRRFFRFNRHENA